jgi:hypothetical protein
MAIARENPRIFTLEEVDALIPTLSRAVSVQLVQQSEIEQRLGELARATGELPRSLDASPEDDGEVGQMKADLRDLIGRYEAGWRKVQRMGVLIKDPQIGLLDFYGRIDGRLVYLCWRYGEEALGYYHELEAGFAGRRPLARETREKLLN